MNAERPDVSDSVKTILRQHMIAPANGAMAGGRYKSVTMMEGDATRMRFRKANRRR